MIEALIFFAHFLFALIIFTYKWQNDGLAIAFLNVGLICVLFAVGWSVTGMISKMIIKPDGLGINFTRDTLSLTLLTIIEFFFYKFYFKEPSTEDDKEIR